MVVIVSINNDCNTCRMNRNTGITIILVMVILKIVTTIMQMIMMMIIKWHNDNEYGYNNNNNDHDNNNDKVTLPTIKSDNKNFTKHNIDKDNKKCHTLSTIQTP